MAGHISIPPPRRTTASRVGVVALRILLVLVPPFTLGFLAFVPLVRVAAVRRRAADWALCCIVALLSVVGFALIGTDSSDNGWQTALGMIDILGLALICPVYFLVAELRWHNRRYAPVYRPVPGYPQPQPLPQPQPHQYPAPYQYPNAGVPPYSAPPSTPVPRPVPVAVAVPASMPPSMPASPSPSGGRIDQVRAELDELSAYLHAQEQEQEQ